MTKQNEFDKELLIMLEEARKRGHKTCRIISRVLHNRVRPRPPHKMPSACNAMWKLWRKQGAKEKRIIHSTESGYSSTIEIEFDTSGAGS